MSKKKPEKGKIKKKRKPKVETPSRPNNSLRAWVVGESPVNLVLWSKELNEYKDVLLGRVDPPVDMGRLTLMEVADAYFARASEMAMTIKKLERNGRIDRANPAYKFRTGELSIFMEMCKRSGDLGSRRITYDQMMIEAARTGRSKVIEGDEE